MKQETKGNFLSRLPESVVILILGGLLGYQSLTTATKKDIEQLQKEVTELKRDFNEMHPRK